jgi:cation transport regulator
MPYDNINELPKSVRNLPSRAKTLYMKAFNSAWEENDELADAAREKASHEAAWSAVKLEYEKNENTGEWVKIGEAGGKHSRHAIRHRKSKSSGPSPQAKANA